MNARGQIALAGSVATMSASGVVATIGLVSDVVVAVGSILATVLSVWAMVAAAREARRPKP